MNHWWIGLVTAGLAVALLYVLAPGVFLRLGLLAYPKNHAKRAEFIGEFYYVPRCGRPRWVAGQLSRCVLEGLPARVKEAQQQSKEEEVDFELVRAAVRLAEGYAAQRDDQMSEDAENQNDEQLYSSSRRTSRERDIWIG